MITSVILFLYLFSLFILLLYSIVQVNLVWHYKKKTEPPKKLWEEWPLVTIQLPIYNEYHVVERLLDAVAAFDYPKDRLEIQILDDSTDETSELIRQKIAIVNCTQHPFIHIQRKDRAGFKAGALQYGLSKAKGEYIAIFDSDFVPASDFLKKMLPYFHSENVGMVQARWGHLNKNYNLLTKMQAFGLDAHFTVEQGGRARSGSFINFNGTAGIWKKECILSSGGWSFDTLTEDLDLSYRAQMNGWQMIYTDTEIIPAELPIAASPLKSQQYRWNKGAAETTKKLWLKLIRSTLYPSQKIRATAHLLGSSMYICVLISALLSVPLLVIKKNTPAYNFLFDWAMIFVFGFLCMVLFYWSSHTASEPHKKWYFLWKFPLFMAFSMGLSFHNSMAVLAGYLGIRSPFIRTPKFNSVGTFASKKNVYFAPKINWVSIIEFILLHYFGYGIYLGFQLNDFGLVPFHLLLFFGFLMLTFYSLHDFIKKDI